MKVVDPIDRNVLLDELKAREQKIAGSPWVIAMGITDNRRLMEIVEHREAELTAFVGRNRASRRHG